MKSSRPRVAMNFAITADGKVSTRRRTPARFTSPKDKRRLSEIRSEMDAVLAGAATVALDRMSMGISAGDLREKRRGQGRPPVPLRVIVSNSGKIDPAAKVFENQQSPLLVFSTSRMPARLRERLASLCDLWIFDAGKLDLRRVLEILGADYGVKSLVCEGGPTLSRALLEAGLVDELRLTIAPVLFGGSQAPTLTGIPGDFLSSVTQGKLRRMQVAEGECYLTYTFPRR